MGNFVSRAVAVIVRRKGAHWEFCLVPDGQSSRWQLPWAAEQPGVACVDLAVLAAHNAGVEIKSTCHPLADNQPSPRSNQISAWLLYADGEFRNGKDAEPARHRWCLIEEAQGRLRLKPLRRLLNVALRMLAEHEPGDDAA